MMAYPIYQIIVSISAAGIPVAISIMIAEKLANDDMRGVQQVFFRIFKSVNAVRPCI